jgi:aryl-alcohol dehydrogenase-like predicted oxidoreductase
MPQDVTLPELALRFILSNTDVSVAIPGMRKAAHVRDNIAASEAGALQPPVLDYLRPHRWDREPTDWSS